MIHLLPGMGADRRMYDAPAWLGLPGVRALDWPLYRGEKTLAAVAKRVVDEAKIQDGDVLVGSSLGGMVACEIARRKKLRAVVLIGSAIDKSEVCGLLNFLHPIAKCAPLELLQFSAGSYDHELTHMFRATNASFMRAMCAAVFAWDGLPPKHPRPLRIHGRHDGVIPPPKSGVDLWLDGGHLLAMTHARECVEFVQAQLK